MPKLSDHYFEETTAETLDEMRAAVRNNTPKRRLIYDCFHAKTDGEKVFCGQGHALHPVYAKVNLLPVLRGIRSKICQGCLDFQES